MIRGEGYLIGPGELILTNRWVEGLNDHELVDHVRYLSQLSYDEDFLETHCGGIRDFDSIDEFLRYKRESQVVKASRLRKRNLTDKRRKEFAANRAAIELALIDRDGYVCAEGDCNEHVDLTIDHVSPISRGGGDDLGNLRFLCRSHNSKKGDSRFAEIPG